MEVAATRIVPGAPAARLAYERRPSDAGATAPDLASAT